MLCILKNLSGGPFYFRPCCCSYHQCDLYFTADTQKVQNITLLGGPHLILLTQASTYVFTLDRMTDTERNFLLTVNRQCSRQRSSLMWLRLSNKAIWLNISPHSYRIKLCPCALSNRVCLHGLLHAVFFDCAQMFAVNLETFTTGETRKKYWL